MTTGYITQTQLANLKIMADKAAIDSKLLADLIKSDMASTFKKNMKAGIEYYDCQHEILKARKTYIVDGTTAEDPLKSNMRIPHPFHKVLVDQKSAYIVGNPIAISVARPDLEDPKKPTSEEEKQAKAAKEFENVLLDHIGNEFDDLMHDWVSGASKKAVEWVHFYVSEQLAEDESGALRAVIIPAEGVIPIYDSQYQKRLVALIRYYNYEFVDESGKTHTLIKAEWWTSMQVEYWAQQVDETYVHDPDEKVNPAPHWSTWNTQSPDQKAAKNWGRVPFVPLRNNSEGKTDLEPVKALIDAYDKVVSGWANDLEDFQEALIVLKGYSGLSGQISEGLSELGVIVKNLKAYKVVGVEAAGDVDKLTIEIPVEAKEKFLRLARKAIYAFGEGVDADNDNFGDPSGVALKFLYAGLDLKANRLIRKLKSALTEYMWFVVEHLNRTAKTEYDSTEITFTFNKAVIFNEKEMIEECGLSKGVTSDQTILEHHPWVDDPEQEQKRIDAEEQKRAEKGAADLGNVDPNADPNADPEAVKK